MALHTLREFGLNRPEILTPDLPEVEQAAAKSLERALVELEHILHNFNLAIELYDSCSTKRQKLARVRNPSTKRSMSSLAGTTEVEEARRLSAWRNMAVRDGALQIWKLGRAIASTESALHRLPALDGRANRQGMAKAGKMIEQSFPGYDAIRDAITRGVMDRPSAIRRSKAKANPGRDSRWGFKLAARSRGNIITGISGRVLFVQNGRKLHKYELSEQSLKRLAAAVAQFYDSFTC